MKDKRIEGKALRSIVCVALLAALSALHLWAGESESVARASDEYFKPLLASGRVSAAVCVVVEGDKTATIRLYGPVDPQTSLWRVASVSKVFTAIAIMQLVERGKLQLDDDVNKYLKNKKVPNAFAQPITIREL